MDTADELAQERFQRFNDDIQPQFKRIEHQLNQKLVASGLTPPGMEIAVRRIKNGIELFREDNLPLLSAEQNLTTEYNKVLGAQTVEWEGEQLTLQQLQPVLAGAGSRSPGKRLATLVRKEPARPRPTQRHLAALH